VTEENGVGQEKLVRGGMAMITNTDIGVEFV
jgi:hypothetical protein